MSSAKDYSVLLLCALFAWLAAVTRGQTSDNDTDNTSSFSLAPPQAGMTFALNGEEWAVYVDLKTEKLYYHNKAQGESSWVDPRAAELRKQKKKLTPWDRRMRMLVLALPCGALLAAICGRLIYLQKYYPDLLWPTKERRQRKRYRNKEKMPRQRFKVSQDGKGGRSANS